jgi:FkbH-like protein
VTGPASTVGGAGALEELLAEGAAAGESPSGELCLKIAEAAVAAGDTDLAAAWLRRLVDAPARFRTWHAAALLLSRIDPADLSSRALRTARVAVAGSYNTAQLVPMLRLAGLRAGIDLELHEGGFDQYQHDLLEPGSELYRFEPDYVILAVHDGALRLPRYTDRPAEAVESELERWRGLWRAATERAGARVVQYGFAVPPRDEFGHLGARLPGTRASLIRALNASLGAAAGTECLLVDCDRLAAALGKDRWFDARYWHLAKQAVALDALPALALHTAAVLAGDLGLSRKCIAVDLDNTLWGGVVGEEGLAGIRLGQGADGEAFVAFQETLLALRRRGILLAVCSKNNPEDAREVFERHPDMRLSLDDLACFDASWSTKVESLRRIAGELGIGVDSLVFVDDNPAERELVRQALPEVDVLTLPQDPALYAQTLLSYPFLETTSFGDEDARRTDLYRARREAAELAADLDVDTFLRRLEMTAEVAPVDDFHLPRVAQLIGKTNQFNLTTRRHDLGVVRAFVDDPATACLYLKLRDRYADHGLVGVAIASKDGDVLDIDTFLLSCRVIGRTAERTLLAALGAEAARLGCSALRGTYVPSAKNEVVRETYGSQGFELLEDADGTTTWLYDLAAQGPIENELIAVEGGRG